MDRNDTRNFSMAFLAYAERTGYDGKFDVLPITEMQVVLADAQFLKEIESRSMSTWTDAEMKRYAQITGQYDEFMKGGK